MVSVHNIDWSNSGVFITMQYLTLTYSSTRSGTLSRYI